MPMIYSVLTKDFKKSYNSLKAFFLDKGWTISEIEPALAELVSQLVREYETVSLEV